MIVLLLMVCLRYRRPLDAGVLNELANLLSWVCCGFLLVRFTDLLWRHQVKAAFAFDRMSLLFLFETTLILIPTLALRRRVVRETPRALLNMAALACVGGMLYRFIPTSIAYMPVSQAVLGAVGLTLEAIVRALSKRDRECFRRLQPFEKNLWWMTHPLIAPASLVTGEARLDKTVMRGPAISPVNQPMHRILV